MKQELIRFLIAGGSCFALELSALFSLTEFGGLNYLDSAAIAFTLAVAINYVMCARWVFVGRAARRTATTFLIFISTSVIGLGINQLCMYCFVELGGLHYMIAKIFSTAIVTVWNFVTKRFALSM